MMNIETLLQAAKILESQQAVPPKQRSARGERSTSSSNSNPLVSPPTVSSLLTPSNDLNLNSHHFPQRITSDPNDDDDDDDDDETSQHNSTVNSEQSTRTQSTCLRDREIHNRLEKHRRAHLKDCFDSLKAEVPCQRDRKITNLQVLNFAIKYIQTLTRKERTYEREIAVLNARNVELQQRLSLLKNDLNSQGHDVDSWLNSSTTDVDGSISTRTASEAEMYRTFDDQEEDEHHLSFPLTKPTSETIKYLNGHDDLDTNNNHQGIQSILNPSCPIDSKSSVVNNRKTINRSRPRPAKRKLASIPTTNLLQSFANPTITTSITRSENLLDYSVARHLRLDQPCNLLTTMKDNLSSTATLTPITDIRYDIVDMFTKGTSTHLQQPQPQQQQQQPHQHQHQQVSPLPSIASLMNRHTSPIVSPTKQTIGINTEPLTTSTTNILHQTVATS